MEIFMTSFAMEAQQKELIELRQRLGKVQGYYDQCYREWEELKDWVDGKSMVTRSMDGIIEDMATLEYSAAIAESEITQLKERETVLVRSLRENSPEMQKFYEEWAEAWRRGKPLPKTPVYNEYMMQLKPFAE
jgi:chromosome segregation ATPase